MPMFFASGESVSGHKANKIESPNMKRIIDKVRLLFFIGPSLKRDFEADMKTEKTKKISGNSKNTKDNTG